MRKEFAKYIEEYEQQFLNAKEQLNIGDLPILTEELFSQFEKTGNRLGYEKVYFKRRKYLSVYAILSMLYNNPLDIGILEKVIDSICDEQCWALPAHVNRNDENWQITIDLFAAETAFSLAEIVGKLEEHLSDRICEKVKNEVFRRVITPFMEKEPYAWWENSKINWCAVCCGSIGATAIWFMKDKSIELDRLLKRISTSIMNYIDGFSDDGACLEGMSYYTYGMSFFVAFAELVYEYSNGKIDLLNNEKVKKIALFQQKCYLPGGVSISFSDGSSQEKYRIGLTAYLAKRFEEVKFPDISLAAGLETDNCYRYVVLSRDLFWAKEKLAILNENVVYDRILNDKEIRHEILPDAKWSVSTSANNCAVAVKGGHNDEPHNHNDIGSFMYICDGQVILTDIGAGEYTKDYFNENRYKNICCSSLGHNVPIINGKEQGTGAAYKDSHFKADGKGRTIIGMESAYDLADDDIITRIVEFDDENGYLKIDDNFKFKSEYSVIENLVTELKPHIVDEGFRIEIDGKTFDINVAGGANFNIIEEQYFDHFGELKKVWLMKWKVLKGQTKINISISVK